MTPRVPVHIGDTLWALADQEAKVGIPLTATDVQTMSLLKILFFEDPHSLGVIDKLIYVDLWNAVNPEFTVDTDPDVLRIQVRHRIRPQPPAEEPGEEASA